MGAVRMSPFSGSHVRLGVLQGIAAAVAAICFASSPVGAAEVSVPFCRDDVARDYERPFEQMPGERPPPEGELPFGPRNLNMFRVGWERVVLRGGNLGYLFGAKEAGKRILHLNWDVLARLQRVDAAGVALREVGRTRKRLGDVEGIDRLEFVFPAKRRGLFRLDISFRRLNGGRLGSYREYFRVVRRTIEMSLAVNATTLHSGDTAYSRVENLGTNDMNVPSRYLVERFDGSVWLGVGESVTPGTALDRGGWWLGGGEAAFCTEYPIPSDALPGLYRLRTAVQPFGQRQRRSLTTSFRVEP